jgi:signal transduction histidine kinase
MDALLEMGVITSIKSHVSESIRYTSQALDIYRELTNDVPEEEIEDKLRKQYALALTILGVNNNKIGNYSKSIEYYFETYRLFSQAGDRSNMVTALLNIGTAYFSLDQYEESLKYEHEALKIAEQLEPGNNLLILLNNMATGYSVLKKHDKELELRQRALEVSKILKNEFHSTHLYHNIAASHRNRGEYDKALEYAAMGREVCNKAGNNIDFISSYLIYGSTYREMGEIDKAIENLSKGIELCKECNEEKMLGDALKQMHVLYKDLGDYKKAYEYLKEFNEVNRKVYNEREIERRELLKAQFDVERKEQEAEYQRKINEELRKTNEALDLANRTKDKFFYIIAHDLKNPFNVLLSYSDMVMKQYDNGKTEDIREHLEAINTSAKRNYALLENLLKWSQLQTGKMKAHIDVIDLFFVALETKYSTNSQVSEKNVELILNVSEGSFVNADEHMISAVLRNLLTNAIKFTPDGGTVELVVEKLDNNYRIKVEDTGVGMAQDKIDRLFRLDQNNSTNGTAGEKGTGLGLILCKELVEIHDSRLNIESDLGKGTTVWFDLPAYSRSV